MTRERILREISALRARVERGELEPGAAAPRLRALETRLEASS